MATNPTLAAASDGESIRAYTVAQVADYLQISAPTVRRLVSSGLMPCRRVGVGVTRAGALRFTREDIEEYLRRVRDTGIDDAA